MVARTGPFSIRLSFALAKRPASLSYLAISWLQVSDGSSSTIAPAGLASISPLSLSSRLLISPVTGSMHSA